jgi:hypothetical protein
LMHRGMSANAKITTRFERPGDHSTGARCVTSKSQWWDLVEGAHRGLSAVRFRSKHSAGCLSPRASGSLLRGHMQLRLLVTGFCQRSLLVVFCMARNSCQSHKANSAPSIEFTHIPSMARGGRERVDTISGRVRNARPKQQIVIYAHSGPWWVQPWPPYLGS